nr:AraC family transcriptional regulator [Paenibacillus sp. F411]
MPYVCYPEWIGRYQHLPHHQVDRPAGWLSSYNLHLVFSGKGTVREGREVHEMTTGTGFLYDIHAEQHYRADDKEPWDVYWIHFQGDGVEQLLGSVLAGGRCWKFHFSNPAAVQGLLDDMIAQCEVRNERAEIRLSALLYELLLELRRESSPWDAMSIYSERERIHRSAEYIRHHVAEHNSLAELAAVVGYSPSHFSRTFHRIMGMTPVQYLNESRIIEAKKLLVTSRLPVKDIAIASGFSQSSYFIRRFQEYVGMTPQTYRELHAFG